MKQLMTFVRKEFHHVFRDRKTLLMLFGLPVVQILLFGFALSNEIKSAKVVILDQAGDPASREIIERLGASTQFEIQSALASLRDIERALQGGEAKMAVVLPPNFNGDLLQQGSAQVQFITDATDPNTATTLIQYATAIIKDYQRDRFGGDEISQTVATEVRMLYNPELEGATNFVPGVMALVLMLICVMMTAVSIVREKEMGTMEVLLVSPFNPLLVVLSKAVPYLFLSLVNLVVILVLGVTLLGLPIQGSLPLLFALSTLFIITALALGLLISNVANSQQSAMLFSMMGLLLPTMLFTGFMFPIENMPLPLQWITNLVPSKWYYLIVKAIMIKGLGFSAIWKETLILFTMCCVFLFLSIKNFKTRLA